MDLTSRQEHRYWEGLSARIEALEAAKEKLREGSLDAIDSIRRIAHSLQTSSHEAGYKETSEAASQVIKSVETELPKKLEILLTKLHEATKNSPINKTGILIVEDEPSISILLQELLSAPNREVHMAKTGQQAEQILMEKDISLILLDLMLPDMDGRNLLIRMRERPSTAETPIIVLTAKGSGPKAECFALGADVYFEKPFDSNTL